MSEKMLGYPIFGYWYFFNDAEAAGLMDRNVHIHSRFYLFTHSIHYILHEANMTCTAQGRVSRLTVVWRQPKDNERPSLPQRCNKCLVY